jgi:hypothetical protein
MSTRAAAQYLGCEPEFFILLGFEPRRVAVAKSPSHSKPRIDSSMPSVDYPETNPLAAPPMHTFPPCITSTKDIHSHLVTSNLAPQSSFVR